MNVANYLPETYRPNGTGIKLGKLGSLLVLHHLGQRHSGLMFNFHPYTAMDFDIIYIIRGYFSACFDTLCKGIIH